MKKSIAFTALIALLLVVLVSCAPADSIDLPKLELKRAIDNSVPIMTGDNSELLTENIDRGFRLETYYTLGSGKAWPSGEQDGYEMLNEEIEHYSADKANEIQVYIYLNEYSAKPLDDKAFDQLKKYFEYIRSLRMSMLLRFAYDYEQGNWVSPTETVMLGHLGQLKQFFTDNSALANDTITALQFGCIGAWGEWGATGAKYNEKKILSALVDMMPDGTYFQGRYMRVTNQLKKNARYSMVGYHNDFLVGRPHPWNTAGDRYYSGDYKHFVGRNSYTLNDGEMPWGGKTEEPNEYVDGKNFIKQMVEHSMTTLSIKHNYTETDGEVYNIARWKNEYFTARELEEMNCPYYASYFKDMNGNDIKRSVYEYLRDFLGYHLVASNLDITDDGKQINFIITNFGMGAPLTLDSYKLLVGNKEFPLNVNANDLVTYGQVSINIRLDDPISDKKIGLKITRYNSAGDYHIRTANNIDFSRGINWLR